MSTADLLLQDYDFEINNTRRTMERIPEDKNDFRSHDKSMPLGKLAMHCATLPLFGAYILEDDGMDMAASKHPQASLVLESREACLQKLSESAERCRKALTASSDDALAQNWRFSFGEHLISDLPRSVTFRMLFFNHLIHHTAQLGVYLRLLDIPVPALYGPSADEQWTPAT